MQSAPVVTRPHRRAFGTAARRIECSAVGVEKDVWPNVKEGYWTWKTNKIRYQRSGEEGPAVILIHGFGGNCDHWRKNTGVLGQKYKTYAIDLLGYGYSDKPDPRNAPRNSIYCFDNWARQVIDFLDEVVQEKEVFLVSNSVGGLAALEAALLAPAKVKGVQLIDISLRGLHVDRTSPVARPFIAAFQTLLRETSLGKAFFGNVARPETVKKILGQAYGRKDAVTDELVDVILKPGLQPGAVDVFLDFISYSGGPLPERLLAKVQQPVSILWGEQDPWEDMNAGRALFSGYPCVEEFVPLPGIGHCPQDEAPEVVNPLIDAFITRHAGQGVTPAKTMALDVAQ